MRLETMAVRGGRGHADREWSGRMPEERGRPHVPGIDLSTTYTFDSSAAIAESMDTLLAGEREAPNPVYARLYNPTVAGFEEALAAMEVADASVAFSTGMAAITALLITAGSEIAPEGAARGKHVVGVRPIYGGTDHLLTSGLLGHQVTWTDPDGVAEAIRPDTGLVILETPANPTLRLTDIRAVVTAVRERGREFGVHIPVAVDSTFATPILQTPLTLGADLVIHSATKFLGGHGDVMGGVIASSEAWAAPLRQTRMITGAILHPLGGYMLHRGLQTLPVRVRAQQDAAGTLAARLASHPAIHTVMYPGLSGDATERRLLATQQKGPGSLLSFRVRGGVSAAREVIESLSLISRAVSLGSVDSLIQAPAHLTHRVVDPADRADSGLPDDLLRMSVGLESVEDLWTDLDRALQNAQRSVA